MDVCCQPTRDEVLLKQQQYINDHLHPKVSRSRLEVSEARPRPSLGRLTSGFRMYPRVLSARAEAHEKTRVRTPILSTNAVRIVFAHAGELSTFKLSMDRPRLSLGRLSSGFRMYPRHCMDRAG